MGINYYQILGLEQGASKEEIKKAYRLYSKKYHPDKQKGDSFFEERIKEINIAYENLMKENRGSRPTSSYKWEAPNPKENIQDSPGKRAREIRRNITKTLAQDIMRRLNKDKTPPNKS